MAATQPNEDDLKAITRLADEFFAGVNSGDLERRMATIAADVIVMPPDRPAIVGREEHRRLSHEYAAAFDERCSVVLEEIETAGDLGFARATVNGTRTAKGDGAVDQVRLKNLWIFRKEADGQWKFWRIMFNSQR